MNSVEINPNCEACPLVRACDEAASIHRGLATNREQDIEYIQSRPQRIKDVVDRLDIELTERVAELTYDSISNLTSEEAEALHESKKRVDKDFRDFEEIVIADEVRTQIGLETSVQQAYRDIAEASEAYAAELQSKCTRGVGVARTYGIIGTKHLFCQSDGQSPNLNYFEATETYKLLRVRLDEAHADLAAFFQAAPDSF